MKNKIILYDHQRLNLECMSNFLDREGITKNYSILNITNFDDIQPQILEKGSVLILNIAGMQITEITDHIEQFLAQNPYLKIMVHSENSEVRTIKKFFDKGVKSFLGSNVSSEEFLDALNNVTAGKIYINDDTKNILLNFICSVDEPQDRKSNGVEELTAREKDVLLLICDGLRSKEIAEKLFISTHTVESHRRNMMLKFNINSSSKLVKFAMENRLIEY